MHENDNEAAPSPDGGALAPEERTELERHEAALENYKEAEFEAGRALRAIRDKRLYRATHADFESYCAERWGFRGRNAYHLIDAADVLDDLTAADGVDALPAYASHARGLATLSVDDRVAVWKGLVEEQGPRVTTNDVTEAVKALKDERGSALAEDGTAEPPAVSAPLQAVIDRERREREPGAPGPVAVVGDLVVLGDEPPEVEPDEYGTLVVSVPRTLYPGAPGGKPYVLTTLDDVVSGQGRELDREMVRLMRDEIERLGYEPKFNLTNESIDWAAWTWNPETGCKHGCDFCYAREIARRFTAHYPQGFRPTIHPGRLLAPANTPLPALDPENPGARHVFVDSMGDLFGKWVPDAFIEEVLDVIRRHPEWTFKALTKYPKRLPDFEYPENLWVGTSVVSQNYVAAVEEAMADVRAAVRWVSCEPFLTPIVFSRPELFDLYVIGARTKANGLPELQPEPAWVDALRLQARSVGAAVFEKANLRVHLREFPTPKSERIAPTPARPAGAGPSGASGDGKATGPLPDLGIARPGG